MYSYAPLVNTSLPKNNKKNIGQVIKKTKGACLIHFTRIENLKSILQFGILPTSILKSNKTFAGTKFNSISRPNGWDQLVSLNLSFPDYKLFTQLQNHEPSEWVVLTLDIRLLNDIPAYFFPGRALDFITPSVFPNEPLLDYQASSDLRFLFSDQGELKRGDLEIPAYYPTNPYTEILTFLPIAPSYITQVFFYSDYKFNQWVLTNTAFAVGQNRERWACGLQYFSPRSDYTYWKTVRTGNILD